MRKKFMASAILAAGLAFGGTAFAQFGNAPAQSAASTNRAEVYGRLISTRITVDFTENPMRDVIDFLSEISNIDIITKWDESGFGDGLDPEVPITLSLRNETSLEEILGLVMAQATDDETSWSLGDGYIEIGPKEMLNQKKYVLIYPVRELLFTVPVFDEAPEMDLESVLGGSQTGEMTGSLFRDEGQEDDQERISEEEQSEELIDIITSIVDPLQWEKNGGDGGSIRYFRGSLIINASDYLHRQVGGYPYTVAQMRGGARAQANARSGRYAYAPRYVTLTGRFGFTDLVDIEQYEVPVLVGGRVISSGGGGGG